MKKEFRRLASDSNRGTGDAAADAFPTGSGKEIRILFVEDVISDFELTIRELKQAGVACAVHRVDTREGLLRELKDFEPDVILSDFSLPTFDGLSVLMIVRELRPDIPCIFVSGTISEDQLISLVRHGAADYVLKSNLERIPPAVLRAVQERNERAARRQAEQALKESEALLDSVFDNIPSMLFIKDAKDLRFVRFNRTGEELLGRSEKDLLGKNDYDFFPKEQADLFVAKDRETLASNQRVFIMEEKIEVKDGTERMLQTKKLAILDEQGNPRFLLGISEDVTERKQAEQQIRDSEAKYRGLIEQASDGIFVSDAEGNLVLANSRLCELLGYAKDEVTGLNARQTYLEEERETHAKLLEQVRAGQTLRYERTVQRKDGSHFPAEISLKMLDNGLIQGIFHDITTRRAQEHKIARLSRIQAVLSGINSAIVRIRDRQTLFDEVCRLSIEHGGFALAWIRMTTPDAQGGRPIAWRCSNDSYLDLIPLSIETDAGRAHAERVMSEKRAVVYNDLTQAGDFPFAGQALQAGALSLAKLPLVVSGEAVG
ncbi:MAG TPA: PAS domain S-box protein, partial [Burkholderiales bacterium]|nr:PAS domain S-box protein [Burkholderiales bacterium]